MKWKDFRINKKLMNNIFKRFKNKEFTNNDVYKIYKKYHLNSSYDNFTEMNVRNNLCAASYRGEIIRIGSGRYKMKNKKSTMKDILGE